MKRIIVIGCFLFCSTHVFSQVSLGKYREDEKTKTDASASPVRQDQLHAYDSITKNGTLKASSLIKRLKADINDTFDLYEKKRLAMFNNDTLQNKKALAAALVKDRDSLIGLKKDLIREILYWKRYDRVEESKQFGNFFPAYYSSQAIRFFEDDSTHRKLFQNNLVNYNPQTRKMVLYTEAVNDYIGPIRVGIGFQVKTDAKVDSLSTADSTKKLEKKADMLGNLQNNGGDISVNMKYPIIKSSNRNSGLQYMLYAYANTGFSLPVLNKATEDFLFNYDGGLEGFLYMKGFNNKITFFSQLKAAYYNGNKNYQKVIKDADKNDPTGFLLFQTSFGLDFMDGYRLRADLFSGNQFVRKNFPVSITFVVRPGK